MLKKHELITATEPTLLRGHSPEKSLIVYGSLAPNETNHFVVEHIKGRWEKGTIKGQLFKEGWGSDSGYWGFKPCDDENQAKIEAFILISDELTENWQMLDDFEGNEYKRILTPFELENGEIGVGNIYAIND